MVIAMAIMRVVQASIDQIADMIAMGHGFVTTAWAMDMVMGMAQRVADRGAAVRVDRADFNHMLVDMILMGVMQMAIVQIVHVIAMLNGGVATARAMLMRVIVVLITSHEFAPRSTRVRIRTRHCDQRYPIASLQYNYRN